jgi:hypothetical protein
VSGSLSSFLSGQVVPPQPTGSDTTSSFPLWLQDYTYNLANSAGNLASQNYTPFPGQQVATPSAATQQSWNMATNSVGNYQPALNQAGALTQAASQPIGASQIQQYMNPYTSNVVGALQQAANTNLTQNQLPAIQSQFVGAGQAASPQQMQAANNALYQSNQALDQSTAGALQQGYQGALGTALQEQQMQQTTGAQMGQIGAITQQLGAAQTGEVAAAGQAQDLTNQSNINAAMNNFYSQQQWPYQNLGFASNIIRGQDIPTNQQTVGLQYSPGQTTTASPIASFVGTTLGATGISNGIANNTNGNTSSLFKLARGGRVRRPRGALAAFAEVA